METFANLLKEPLANSKLRQLEMSILWHGTSFSIFFGSVTVKKVQQYFLLL